MAALRQRARLTQRTVNTLMEDTMIAALLAVRRLTVVLRTATGLEAPSMLYFPTVGW